ncbi:adenylate/guanylate cyclase domain-containing protein [Rhodobacterales bacterium 56_14_T64]|nr:adenylate/guanylate cyclase domain-containing protein [Rhodobacterales bacterium 56_14_T64]
MSDLWRGDWATRTRIITGLILFTFSFFHFLNLGLGLFSDEAIDWGQDTRQVITRNVLGETIILAALLTHAGLAIAKLAARRTLRMPAWEATQVVLGLSIPLLLIKHIVHTRVAHEVFGVNDEYGYITVLLWDTVDGAWQSVLLLIVWTHGCMGLHFWLRATAWWRRWFPVLVGFAMLLPGFALSGFLTQGRRMLLLFQDDETRWDLMEDYHWPDRDTFTTLITIADYLLYAFWVILALATLFYATRRILNWRKSVRIRYTNGPEISATKGLTLLEISRVHGVPHTALCGGRGRCTTCRVIIEQGGDRLHPPSAAEAHSLAAVKAPANARLACQIQPSHPLTVLRVFRPDGRRDRAHASQGEERRLAILFLDMRGFTARTTGQLPYDVVFLLNRFFDAIVPGIIGANGTVDKYLGDGLLAVFETEDEKSSARAALKAAENISTALSEFNTKLVEEGGAPVAIGIGLHLGDLVLGEIGAAGNAPRTLIGDSVNTASRLESQTKELGVELLISASLLQAAGHATDCLPLCVLQLRGVSEPLAALPVKQATALPRILASEQS